ncbi:DHODH [Cordylochernes scorpioides]|uniref:Dihydroorotate dehydrogenase (quinone), mitochondrial n=1 Tax=Cordylochernes scorpioides TaxID=51811 RepID=A0ABY6K6W7_9ARAC|nr:DHODH [Cordylochernes scorpioides]
MAAKLRTLPKWKSGLLIAGVSLVGGPLYLFLKNDERFYSGTLMPLVHRLSSPEWAHKLALYMAEYGLVPPGSHKDSPMLTTTVWNREFKNPVGLAAGFDKDARGIDSLFRAGFGFVEVGSVTPEPQPGNPEPRVFRLPSDGAVINRYGFNSLGHIAMFERFSTLGYQPNRLIGINLGKNKDSPSPIDDYVRGVTLFNNLGDYLVLNVSSPNTPGLRSLQEETSLVTLIDEVQMARDQFTLRKPLVLKISPDITDSQKESIARIALEKKVDGLIVSNTTVTRPESLNDPDKKETGGLSGKPLEPISTKLISDMYILTQGKIPIIGVGGISTGEDAYRKIRSGASLVQIYTALIYEGFPVVSKIKRELEECLRKDNYTNISQAVGADHRTKTS